MFLFLVCSFSNQVYQTPSMIYRASGESANIFCSHNIISHNQILWFKQAGKQLIYLGYVYYGDTFPEAGMDVTMGGNADRNQNCTLTVERLNMSSSAVYLCAARYHSATSNERLVQKPGTKLTVTEPGLEVTEPSVEVLKPSAKECKDKNKKRKKTLVCVASQFYPDHVSMSWRLNGVQTDKGVVTGRAIRRPDKSYGITSRLKVQAKDWFRPGNNFTCMVGFYNGNKTTFHSGSFVFLRIWLIKPFRSYEPVFYS
uniref:Ig-like domain-containing protein n=1 Tax=Nothobranchius furzeri TaxID=105023 RepID=A0A8C6PY83_NOTFU